MTTREPHLEPGRTWPPAVSLRPDGSGRSRFVILEHDYPFLHWDLLIQSGQSLLAWRLLCEPVTDCWIPSERIADHRLHYLDYEGPVSGDRGFVRRVFSGTCDVAGSQLAGGDTWTLTLFDCRLASRAVLRLNTSGPKDANPGQPIFSPSARPITTSAAWRFIHHPPS